MTALRGDQRGQVWLKEIEEPLEIHREPLGIHREPLEQGECELASPVKQTPREFSTGIPKEQSLNMV